MALRLFCATTNRGKLAEFRLAAGADVEVEGLAPCDCPEDGATFEENAIAKALCYSRSAVPENQSNEPPPLVFADDSGLVVDALDGAPGVHSARFSGPQATDETNNRLLLAKLAGVPEPARTARFVCWIAVVKRDRLLCTFSGKAEGRILVQAAGSGGFGYDPLFYFCPLKKTFAEVSPTEKWEHSHRGQAFRRALEWLREADQAGANSSLA